MYVEWINVPLIYARLSSFFFKISWDDRKNNIKEQERHSMKIELVSGGMKSASEEENLRFKSHFGLGYWEDFWGEKQIYWIEWEWIFWRVEF